MGPRHFSRGNLRARPGIVARGYRFNGAATLQSRKLSAGTPRTAAPGRFNGAATLQSRKHILNVRVRVRYEQASMGPRHFSRGNRHYPGRGDRRRARFNGAATLQSRKHGRGGVGAGGLAGRFNGAATLQSRKRADAQYSGLRHIASMGPRHFSRGNSLFASIHTCKIWICELSPQSRTHGIR